MLLFEKSSRLLYHGGERLTIEETGKRDEYLTLVPKSAIVIEK
jgi:hypothetical protein